jgi:phage/plasmid-like protein (TIGR03299 family)
MDTYMKICIIFVPLNLKTMSNRVQEVLTKSGLNWGVREETITTKSGIVVPNKKALIREDNNAVLSVANESYCPYQNEQLVELLDKVSQQVGLPIHKGGSFGDGEKVFIQLKSGDLKLGTDRIEGFITGINSFDGSTSLAFGPSNITISCMNTFYAAFRNITTKVRHTKNMVLRIDEICKGLEKVLDEEKGLFEDITKLSETRMTERNQDWVTRLLFDIERQVELTDLESISTQKQNRLSRFYVDLNGELKEKGDNLWGLFSGVTKYTTHSYSKSDSTETKMFGMNGERERQIFKGLVELV